MRPLAAVLLVGLTGCGGPETRTTPENPPTATPVADVCAQFIPKKPLRRPPGMIRPEGEITIGKLTSVPPQIRLEGYITKQPVEVRQYFLRSKKLKVIFSEDEGREAEILVSNGRHRNYWKVVRACDRGSVWAAIIVSEEDAG